MRQTRQDQLDEARATVAEFKALLNSDGWKRLQAIIAANVNQARNEIEMKPPAGMDQMVARESVIGEIRACRRILQIPELSLAEARNTVRSIELEDAETEPEEAA